jgi:aldehyde:ferredoxin oxidoreductase
MIWMSTEGMLGSFSTEKLKNLAGTFWGNEKAAEFDSADYMGAAAAVMQNRAYAKENMICCDFFWPIDFTGNRESGIGSPDLEARLFSAVTGEKMDEISFLLSGERCLNLCRAIYLQEGRQGRKDDILDDVHFSKPQEKPDSVIGVFNPDVMLPGKNGEMFSAKGNTVAIEVFERVMDDYYAARGWDVETGLFEKKTLEALGLSDIVDELGDKVL